MLELHAEAEDCLDDIARAQWEEAATVSTHANNSQRELNFLP